MCADSHLPVLVLLHGLLGHQCVWRDVASELQGECEVVLPNLCIQPTIAQMAAAALRAWMAGTA